MFMTLAGRGFDVASVISALSQDRVILIRNVSNKEADGFTCEIASELGLQESLERQANMSGFLGHRQQISRYPISVISRNEYQFITPHSEVDNRRRTSSG
jgi:hypothetical protein